MIREYIDSDIKYIDLIGSQIKENFIEKFDVINIKNIDYANIYVYEDINIIKGFIHIEDHIDFIDIINVAVDKDYQHEGIASILLDYIVNMNKRIILEVRESNSNAIGLYSKYSFKEINRRKNYYGNEDAIVMERSI